METRTQEVVKCACGCGQEFLKYDSKRRERRFVSGHNPGHNAKIHVEQTCKTCGKTYYRVPSFANRGKNNYCSKECRAADAAEWSGGEKNTNWKGGFNGVQSLRWCPEYRVWRLAIFKRDGYLCQKCGGRATRKNPLHAHHIIPFSESVESRFDVDNGITLCRDCHLKEPKTGWKPKGTK